MHTLLWLVVASPFAGFLLLALAGRRLPRALVTATGVGSIGLSAAFAFWLAAAYLAGGGEVLRVTLWRWLVVGSLELGIGLHYDALALVMTVVVSGVAFFIHLYSAEFMAEDDGTSRFFAEMNLFVGSMLTLVLADNLVLLYLGWEGVGLCSYLLIGFWYRDLANVRAANKAFIVTRVGDAAMALGLFVLFLQLDTLDLQEIMARAAREWPLGSTLAVASTALLLAGALGKSAQLPLQTWLPDAMAGPTPVSALIHAATMVTAGVYLIARLHRLFALAPQVLVAVAAIGAVTMLLAGCSALVQRDIKRVLAYSTISQVGLMFMALGAGAFTAAIFHFMTHAFFKALLFLAAGAVIHGLHHEHDLARMGGLRTRLRPVYWSFFAGAASLSAVPLVTAGFYSKEVIFAGVYEAPSGGPILWAAGVVGAFITGLYAARLVFLVFWGEPRAHEVERHPGARMLVALGVLGVLSIVGGFVQVPAPLPGPHVLAGLLGRVFGAAPVEHASVAVELTLEGIGALAGLTGIAVAYRLFARPRKAHTSEELTAFPQLPRGLASFWQAGWGFDRLYDALFVRPFLALARAGRGDVIDLGARGIARVMAAGNAALCATQSGRLRWYAAATLTGALLILAAVVLS